MLSSGLICMLLQMQRYASQYMTFIQCSVETWSVSVAGVTVMDWHWLEAERGRCTPVESS